MFKQLISGGVAETASSLGEAIDRNVTSDEERLALRNESQEILERVKGKQLDFAQAMSQAITDRWKSDNQSDSWLAKNVRPLVLVFMTLSTVTLAFASVFATLDDNQVRALEAWMPTLMAIDSVIFGAYFGGRSIEKAKRVVQEFKMRKSEVDLDDEVKKVFGKFVK